MPAKIAFIHTVPSLVGLFNDLAKELLPADVEVFHIADELLLNVVRTQGGLSPFIYRRVAEHVAAAEEAGATAVQLTCSSISPCAEAAAPLAGIPVLKIDEPMIDKALTLGSRIGVLATAATTLKPTTDLVYARARAAGVQVTVDPALCEGAYKALFAGDLAEHDRIVRSYLLESMQRNDVVLLAQASMARVAGALPPEDLAVPVLTSPRLAMERLRAVLQGATA